MFILGWLSEKIINLLIWLVSGIYHIAAFIFKVFLILADGRLVDSSLYKEIISNFYIVIGIVVLFLIAFELLKAMVNPDDLKKGTEITKKVVINLITSGILISILPTIFSFLFDFQKSILQQNSIGSFFNYGSDSSNNFSSSDEFKTIEVESFQIVNSVFTAFFNVNPTYNVCESCHNDETPDTNISICCQQKVVSNSTGLFGWGSKDKYYCSPGEYENGENNEQKSSFYCAIQQIGYTGEFGKYANFSDAVDDGELDFNFFFLLIGGALLCYVGISYCFDMALRLIKLVFYQIIAPIPIMMRIIPNDKLNGIFNQWLKITLTCYAEVFVRLFAFYFTIWLCKAVNDADIFKLIPSNQWFTLLITRAFVLLGLIMFIKQAPKLLSEVTGIDSGNMKLGIRDKLKESGAFAIGSAAGSFIASRGNPMAAYRGWKAGMQNGDFKHVGVETQRRRNLREARRNGSTFVGRANERVRNAFGIESTTEQIDRRFEDGYNLINGQRIESKNDTKSTLEIRDENGVVVSTINVGDSMHMTRDNRDKLETTKKVNAVRLSEITEIIRNIEKSSSSNRSLSQMRSDIKQEALDKISEDKSTYTETITLSNGTTFSGNYQSLLQQRDMAKSLGTLSDSELVELTTEIGKAQDILWERYANDAINDTTGAMNAKIRNVYEQMEYGYQNGYLQSDVGESYDRTLDVRGLNHMSGIQFVNELDKAAKTYNNDFNLEKQRQDDVKADIDEQNTIIDRMTNQYTEYIDAARRSRLYTAATANKEYVNKDDKK